MHYELIQRRDKFGVDLHLEDSVAAELAPTLMPFAGRKIGPLDTVVEWDQTWNKNRGRLKARLPLSTEAGDVAAAMSALISLTTEAVRSGLQRLQ